MDEKLMDIWRSFEAKSSSNWEEAQVSSFQLNDEKRCEKLPLQQWMLLEQRILIHLWSPNGERSRRNSKCNVHERYVERIHLHVVRKHSSRVRTRNIWLQCLLERPSGDLGWLQKLFCHLRNQILPSMMIPETMAVRMTMMIKKKVMSKMKRPTVWAVPRGGERISPTPPPDRYP